MSVLALRSVFFGLVALSMRGLTPRVVPFAIDPSSVLIRQGDPVKEIAGGQIIRCSPTDTAILGFAAEGQNSNLPSSIAFAPRLTNGAGNPIILIFVCDTDTVFMGETMNTPTEALRTTLHDLAYAAATGSTPTVANVGTAGSTAYSYTITAVTTNGESTVGTAGTTATGNAALSATNYNAVTIPFVNSRVLWFNVYRGGFLVGQVQAPASGNAVFNDVGAAVGAAPPTVNMTGWVINDAANTTAVAKIDRLDDRPALPGAVNRLVQFRVPGPKSQWQDVGGA